MANHLGQIRDLRLSPDGASGGLVRRRAYRDPNDADNPIQEFAACLFDVPSGGISRAKAHLENVSALAFHPTRPVLALGHDRGRVVVATAEGEVLGESVAFERGRSARWRSTTTDPAWLPAPIAASWRS